MQAVQTIAQGTEIQFHGRKSALSGRNVLAAGTGRVVRTHDTGRFESVVVKFDDGRQLALMAHEIETIKA